MKQRTAETTGRTAELQLLALRRGSFSQDVAMVELPGAGFIRPLAQRLPPRRVA